MYSYKVKIFTEKDELYLVSCELTIPNVNKRKFIYIYGNTYKKDRKAHDTHIEGLLIK